MRAIWSYNDYLKLSPDNDSEEAFLKALLEAIEKGGSVEVTGISMTVTSTDDFPDRELGEEVASVRIAFDGHKP